MNHDEGMWERSSQQLKDDLKRINKRKTSLCVKLSLCFFVFKLYLLSLIVLSIQDHGSTFLNQGTCCLSLGCFFPSWEGSSPSSNKWSVQYSVGSVPTAK